MKEAVSTKLVLLVGTISSTKNVWVLVAMGSTETEQSIAPVSSERILSMQQRQ